MTPAPVFKSLTGFRVASLLAVSATITALVACGGEGAPSTVVDASNVLIAAADTPQPGSPEPALETPVADLEKALVCTPFSNPAKPPVLLVHGTLTSAHEQYQATYLPLLVERGFDVCTVTYPDRGLGDMQVSAEYVVHALRRIHERSGGRKIAMVGHSQGGLMPRWALKWWPSVRELVADFVMQAAPHQGTRMADINPTVLTSDTGLPVPGGPLGTPAVLFQFRAGSNFIAALNRGDVTPGDIDYTNLYTQFDELVQPVSPVPTAALEFGQTNPKVANILLQDICPGRLVDHVTIGLTDRLSFELMLDAISNPGPADVKRTGGAALCGTIPVLPDQMFASSALGEVPDMLRKSIANGLPNLHLMTSEPKLKAYAQQ